MRSPLRHSRFFALALLVALGLFATQRGESAQKIAMRQPQSSGRKIEFSDPVDPVLEQAQKKKAASILPDTLSLLTRNGSPIDNLQAVPDVGPEIVPTKKQKKPDWMKANKVDNDPLSELDRSASPYTLDNSKLTRAWGDDESDDSDQKRPKPKARKNSGRDSDTDTLDDSSSRNDSSRVDWLGKNGSDKKDRSERAWGGPKSAFGDSDFRKFSESARDQFEEAKNREDRQNRLNEFRALYNMSSSTTPVGVPNPANPIHESLWQSPAGKRGFDQFSSPSPSLSQPMRSKVPGFGSGVPEMDSAPSRGRQYQYQDPQNQRYQPPTMLEMPKPPGSLMR